jgi:hypothetical protein
LINFLRAAPDDSKQSFTRHHDGRQTLQRDTAEAVQQLALFPAGRDALLLLPLVTQALEEVVVAGTTQSARHCAQCALQALSASQLEVAALDDGGSTGHLHHVMISYNCESGALHSTTQHCHVSYTGRGVYICYI